MRKTGRRPLPRSLARLSTWSNESVCMSMTLTSQGHWRKNSLHRRHLGISEHADTEFGPAVMKCATDKMSKRSSHVDSVSHRATKWPDGFTTDHHRYTQLARFSNPRKCTSMKTRHPDSLPSSDSIAFERDVADPARTTSRATFFCSVHYPAEIHTCSLIRSISKQGSWG
jgi:hypothetical protein